LSVQPWGSDGHERRYFLIEGLDDTHFRVYRETNLKKFDRQWSSVAGDIEELKGLAEKLVRDDNTKNAKILSGKILNGIPQFEATEEVSFLACLHVCINYVLTIIETSPTRIPPDS